MRRAIPIALVACLATAGLHADYKDSYRKAIQARNRGRWAEAARYLQEALAEQSQETGERVNISGMDYVQYLPHYYLGLARFNTGDCVGALEAWKVSESQGTIKRTAEAGNLARLRKECEARVAKSSPPPPPKTGPDPAAVNAAVQAAEAALTRAQDAEKTVSGLEADPLLGKVWRTETGLGSAQQRARDALGAARGDLDAGRREPNLDRLKQAQGRAESAAQQFETVRQLALTRREDLRKTEVEELKLKPLRDAERKEAERKEAERKEAERKDAERKEALRKDAERKEAERREAERKDAELKEAERKEAERRETERKEAERKAKEQVGKREPFTPPAELAAAARLFFTAQYQEAAASLARQRYEAGPAAAQAALLRAASAYSLYVVGGERDAKLLDQARQAVLETRRLAPALTPDPRAFSPRFIQLYNATR